MHQKNKSTFTAHHDKVVNPSSVLQCIGWGAWSWFKMQLPAYPTFIRYGNSEHCRVVKLKIKFRFMALKSVQWIETGRCDAFTRQSTEKSRQVGTAIAFVLYFQKELWGRLNAAGCLRAVHQYLLKKSNWVMRHSCIMCVYLSAIIPPVHCFTKWGHLNLGGGGKVNKKAQRCKLFVCVVLKIHKHHASSSDKQIDDTVWLSSVRGTKWVYIVIRPRKDQKTW